MLVINYNGNKPTTDYFKYSVQGNNNADVVRFLISLNQGGLVFSENYHIYAKVQSVDDDYYDKVRLTDVEFDTEHNLLKADFVLKAQQTANKQIEVALSCENLNEEIVWQTQIVKITIANGVDSDSQIEDQYPSVLQDLQEQIDEIIGGGGGGDGGSTDIAIEKIYLTYDDKRSIRYSILATSYDDLPFTNDSSRIWVNFETSPINARAEREIKNGRFIIRLDYPTRNKSGNHIHSRYWEHALQPVKYTKNGSGMGSRSFARGFGVLRNTAKKQILSNSLIFVQESDIKTNAYGEKYIHKKVSFIDLINKMCKFEQVETIEALTNDELANTDWGRNLFENELEDTFSCGIPTTEVNGDSNNATLFMGSNKAKMIGGSYNILQGQSRNLTNINNGSKLNPTFNCYALTKMTMIGGYSSLNLKSPYLSNKASKGIFYYNFNADFVWALRRNEMGEISYDVPTIVSRPYMVAKPRCAVVNDNYEEVNNSFIKTYSQSEQQIRLVCRTIKDHSLNYGYLMPIFRVFITKK